MNQEFPPKAQDSASSLLTAVTASPSPVPAPGEALFLRDIRMMKRGISLGFVCGLGVSAFLVVVVQTFILAVRAAFP